MRLLSILALLFAGLAQTAHAEEYEFPKGFPLKASEVEWYTPTQECQEGAIGSYGRPKSIYSQSWNLEIPWLNAGLHKSPNAQTFKFRRLGKGEVKHWREHQEFFREPGSYRRWSYPKGTIFGELIQADGYDTEIFLLEFKDAKEPVFHRWRPFGKRDEIAKYITGERIRRERFRNTHNESVIDVTGLVHEVTLSAKGIEDIRARKWRDVIDVVFWEHDGLKAYGCTTTQKAGIAPIASKAGLFSSTNCLECHRTAGAEGRMIDPDPQPDKYGTIRGGGFVFSHDP